MGAAKAGLEWHGSTLLYRAAAILVRAVDGPVVVVAAPGQELPALPGGVAVVEDPVEGLGPMQGLAAGLAAVADRAEVAFVCSTDMPFLHPAFVRRVLRGLTAGVDVALPVAHGFRQPLAAGYRTALAGLVAELLARGNLRPGMLYEHCAVARLDDTALLDDAALARHDPELASVLNVNTPQDYAAARSRAPAEVVVEHSVEHSGERTAVGAATVRQAAEAAGLTLGPRLVVEVNGVATRDALEPLAAGDEVVFRPA
jgi:molybdopterin-guanine dinucleotide biosynthesis protein A